MAQLSRGQFGALVALAAIWGASFMFIEVMLEAMGPIAIAWLRLGGGAALVLVIATARGARWPRSRRYWLDAAVLGLLASAVPLTLIPWGQREVSSQLAGVLNSATPLWTALLASLFLADEHITGRRGVGLVLGFAGAVAVVGGSTLDVDAATPEGALAVILATVCYGGGAVWVRARLRGVDTTLLAGTSSALAVAMLTPVLLAAESVPSPSSFSPEVALASLGLALLSSGVAYVIYYWLLATAGATQASSVTYLIPAFALAWGAAVLDESFPPRALPGLALIAAGIWLVTRAPAERAPLALERRAPSEP